MLHIGVWRTGQHREMKRRCCVTSVLEQTLRLKQGGRGKKPCIAIPQKIADQHDVLNAGNLQP
jgi:hypothetical protein